MILRVSAVVGLCLGLLAGCVTMQKSADFTVLDVEFSWEGVNRCSSASPAFTVKNVPDGTATLIFRMKDLDVPTYNHGGGSVAYTGDATIPAGAFQYKGPCPPDGSHDYEFTVKAVDAAGDVLLGEGKAVRAFPPK